MVICGDEDDRHVDGMMMDGEAWWREIYQALNILGEEECSEMKKLRGERRIAERGLDVNLWIGRGFFITLFS